MNATLNLDLLQTLVAVAETGELKKAAERVFRSHSAVSMQIQRLEKVAGAPILERNSRGVSLTDKGQVLLSYGKRLLQLNSAALAALREDDLSFRVSFGIPTDYAQAFIIRFLPRLREKFPNLKPVIQCDRSRNLRKRIRSGALDLAVVAGEPGGAGESFLWGEALKWVVSNEFEFREDQVLPVAVSTDNCIVKDLSLEGLKKTRISHETVFSSPVLENVAHAVYNGMAAALLPESLAPAEKTRPLPREILSCEVPLSINLISSSRMEESVVNAIARHLPLCFHPEGGYF